MRARPKWEVTLSRRAARRLTSRVYAVYWPDEGVPAFERERPIHAEVATL